MDCVCPSWRFARDRPLRNTPNHAPCQGSGRPGGTQRVSCQLTRRLGSVTSQAPQTAGGISALIPPVLPHSPNKHPPHQPVISRKTCRIIVRTDRSRAAARMWAAERDCEPGCNTVTSGTDNVSRRSWSGSMIVGLDGCSMASPASHEYEPQHLLGQRAAVRAVPHRPELTWRTQISAMPSGHLSSPLGASICPPRS
jgi:hypothetical protein